MSSGSHGRPFTAAINALRDKGYRFQDLAQRSDDARSTAWFNNLVNSPDPWAVSPPSDRTWPGLAKLLGVTEQHLRALIAAEWLDVAESTTPASTRALADLLDDLAPRDVDLITALARRLKQGPRSTLDDQLDDLMASANEPLPDYFAATDDGEARQ